MNDVLGESSMTTPLVIVGAGGHAREVLDVVKAMDAIAPTWSFLGFVADDGGDLDEVEALGEQFLGAVDQLEPGGAYCDRLTRGSPRPAGRQPRSFIRLPRLGLGARSDPG